MIELSPARFVEKSRVSWNQFQNKSTKIIPEVLCKPLWAESQSGACKFPEVTLEDPLKNHVRKNILSVKTDSTSVKSSSGKPSEQKAVAVWLEKIGNMTEAPKFVIDKNNKVSLKEDGDAVLVCAQLLKSTGCTDPVSAGTLIDQAASTMFTGSNAAEKMNFCTNLMHGLHPQNELEGVVITQMLGAHNLAMEYMRRSILHIQPAEVSDSCVNKAFKMMSMFLRQLEALEKLRGKTGNQKVTVEHVYVGSGGQAIVGSVEASTRGGKKKRDQG